MRKHKAPPSGSPRTMPQDSSTAGAREDSGAAVGAGAGAGAVAGESPTTESQEQQQQQQHQCLLLGHSAAGGPASAAAAAAASRLAPPTCQPPINSSSKERPRPTVRFVSLLHVASYVLCLCAFSFALYGNVRQTRLEQRMQRLQQLDARIVELELRLEQQQLLHWPADQAQILASDSATGDTASGNGSQQHLALHVRRELHRLRRDVSHLQLTRRQQRRQAAEAAAAAAASGEGATGSCQCQAGEWCID